MCCSRCYSTPGSRRRTPGGFDIDAVSTGLVAELHTRHPHVFAGSEQVRTASVGEMQSERGSSI